MAEQAEGRQLTENSGNVLFSTTILSSGVPGREEVSCAVPYDHGQKIAFGTKSGVYFQTLSPGPVRAPVKVLDLVDVQQVDVLEENQILIVKSGNAVSAFPLGSADEPLLKKRMERISSMASFFQCGTTLGRTFVCIVKATSLSSTIKMFEPIDSNSEKQSAIVKLFQGDKSLFRVFREFYIPVEVQSVRFMRTKLCLACAKGFDIVDIETLDTQALLDPSDPSLDFVLRRKDVRPLDIYRIDEEFLVCYTKFAFYVNKSGRRTQEDKIIYWKETPTAVALHREYPYILAFSPKLIEVRDLTGNELQIIRGDNIRCLFADNPPSRHNGGLSTHSQPQASPDQQGQGSRNSTDRIVLISDNKLVSLGPSALPVTSDTPTHQSDSVY